MSKNSNPWMPASNGVFGGGAAYNKNTYSVRGRGAANNPWVQQSGWWENIVEGNYQKGFGQASHSNEYYSTEPVSLQAMRRMRTITVLLAGGAILGATAAAGLFSGGGGAAVAGGTAATTTGGGGVALGSGGLLTGGDAAGTGITTAQALTTAGSLVGGVVGNSLLSSQGESAGQGGNNMGNGGNGNSGGNTPMNALGNPLTPGWPPTQPSGNPQPNQQSRNRRRRREESDGENMDTSDYDYWEQQYQEMTRNTMRGYGMSYGGNGTYAKTTGREGYGNPNKPKTQAERDTVKQNTEEYQQNSFEYRDPQDTLNNEFPWQEPVENTPRILKNNETGWGIKIIDGEPVLGTWISETVVEDKQRPWKKADGYRGKNLNKPQMVNALNARIYAGTEVINSLHSNTNLPNSENHLNNTIIKQNVVLNSPVENAKVSSEFGKTRNILGKVGKHGGTDYSVPTGTEVKATASGKVIRSDYSTTFGNVIIIDHGPSPTQSGNVYTLYAHGSELLVSKGSIVNAGDVIMLSGNTGSQTEGEHLHYEVILYEGQPNTNDFYSIKTGAAIRFTPDSLIQLLNR